MGDNERRAARREGSRSWLTHVAMGALILVLSAPLVVAGEPALHKVPRVSRRAVENLQRWVNGGHDTWCKDARVVASAELRRMAPEFSGDELDLVSLPLEPESKSSRRIVLAWSSVDGSARYRVILRRYEWLKPMVHNKVSDMVWVPVRVEMIRIEMPLTQCRALDAEVHEAGTPGRSIAARLTDISGAAESACSP